MLNSENHTAVSGRRVGMLGFVAIVLAFVLLIAGGALAQEEQSGSAPSPSERERLESLLQTLENDGARAELTQQIRTLLDVTDEAEEPGILPFLPQAESIGAQGLTYLSDQIGQVGNHGAAVVDALGTLPQVGNWVFSQLEDPRTRDRWIEVAASLAIVIGVAVAVRLVAIWLIRPARRVPENAQDRSAIAKLMLLGLAGLFDLIPLVAFLAAAYVALGIIDPTNQVRLVALAVINASAITGLIAVITRMILTPRRPPLRLLPLSDETAIYFYLWFRRIAFTTVYGFFAAEAGQALGMPLAIRNAVLVGVGAAVAIMVIIVILQNRAALAARLRGPVPVRPRSRSRERQSTMDLLQRRFADVWHLLAIAFVLINFAIFALDVEGGVIFMITGTALTVVTVIIAKLALRGFGWILTYLLSKKSALTGTYPALEKHWDFYITLLNKLGKGLILIVSGLALLEIWALGGFAWTTTEFGRASLASAVTISIIILLAVFAWELVGNAVERRLSETDEDGNTVEPTGRTKTLLPLLRNAFMIMLLTVVILVILSEIGVNIAPLLAGAGVIGLAIGFGAQALVRDVITGLFILFEDWFNVGDVVDIGGQVGVVEGLTIRTVRLRDLSGNVHMIQFGDVTTATNMTKEFSYAVIDIGVAYRENTDYVVNVLAEIAEKLKEDSEYGPSIIEPLEVLGVDSFSESAVIIRVRFKTAPIKQWWISREFRRRVKLRFDELGIELPIPHTRMYFGENKDGTAPAARLRIERPGSQPQPARKKKAASGGTADTVKPLTASTQDFEPLLEEIEKEMDEADSDDRNDADNERTKGETRHKGPVD